MDVLFEIVQQTMFYSIPLLVVALGGMFSEKSGIVNIALEGIMVIGAFSGIFFINIAQNNLAWSPNLILFLGITIAILTGILFSLLHAYASINLKADQVISGTALNLLAPALVVYIARLRFNVRQISFMNQFRIKSVPLFGDIPLLGPLFFQNTYFTTYLGLIILVLTIIVIKYTRFGLRLSACGEHPHAAESVGVNVIRMRWLGVIISGALAGLGGLIFIVPTSVNFGGTVGGYGFLALAVMIFGQWNPKRILFAAFFFGVAKAVSSMYTIIPILNSINIPNVSYLYKMLPYIATLFVLIFTSKSSRAPKAEGIPYVKGAR